MPIRPVLPVLALVPVLLASPPASAQCSSTFTQHFALERCHFTNKGDNPYFPLQPGTVSVLEGDDEDTEVQLTITVTCDTRTINFTTPDGVTLQVKARVVEERETEDEELVEVSRNYFAQCRETGDVYYFGEETDIYEDGEIVSHEGAWLAGEDGAQPGLIMPGTPLLGSRFFQEVAPGVALDQAEIVEGCLDTEVPASEFEQCIRTRETTPLEPSAEEFKVYCPDVGLVIDASLELTEQSTASCGSDRDTTLSDEARGKRR
jgi:hypothetical protein